MSLRTDRKLSMQGLEQRQLMAGDVAAHVENGTLFIEGDNRSNTIEVRDVGGGDLFYIRGINTTITDQDGRTINGIFDVDGNSAHGAFNNVVFRMNNGHDRVTFVDANNANFTGGFSVDMGSGRDVFSMQNWDVSEGLNVYNSFGLRASISDSNFGNYLSVNATDIDISNTGVSLQRDDGFGTFLYGANTIDVDGLTTRSLEIGTRDFQKHSI